MKKAERMLKSEAARKRRRSIKELRQAVQERLFNMLRKKRKKSKKCH